MGILREAVEMALKHLARAGECAANAEASDALFFGARDILELGIRGDNAEAKTATATSAGLALNAALVIGGKAIPNVMVGDLVNLTTLGFIPAIKEHRARTGFGLKESKDAIEAIRDNLRDLKYVPSYTVVVDRAALDNLLINAESLAAMFKPGNDHQRQATREAVERGAASIRSSREP